MGLRSCVEKRRLTRELAESREACLAAIKFLADADSADLTVLRARAEDCLELYRLAREKLERHIRNHGC